nr:6,7-dimethyl-8-ribityllumazine synthase [Gammaproteobacteria bacterium]
ETSHHDHLAEAVSQGLMRVSLNHRIPLGFGLITASNYEQAQERADVDAFKSAAAAKRSAKGGKSNKGYEAALAVLEMLLEKDFSYKLRELARNAPAK